MMHPYQRAAYEAIGMFVIERGGDIFDIVRSGQSYIWTSPEGHTFAVGWEEPVFELPAVRLGKKQS